MKRLGAACRQPDTLRGAARARQAEREGVWRNGRAAFTRLRHGKPRRAPPQVPPARATLAAQTTYRKKPQTKLRLNKHTRRTFGNADALQIVAMFAEAENRVFCMKACRLPAKSRQYADVRGSRSLQSRQKTTQTLQTASPANHGTRHYGSRRTHGMRHFSCEPGRKFARTQTCMTGRHNANRAHRLLQEPG